MYNFTSFTVTLNELQPGMERTLAPTDCRLRPDIRSMENGDMGACWGGSLGGGPAWAGAGRGSPVAACRARFPARAAPDPARALALDLASQEKERLEEKQREARRERDKGDTEWQTR